MFQFPSNGKDFLNLLNKILSIVANQVSIPFKRERLSEQLEVDLLDTFIESFNSLQTGKTF